MSSRRILIVDDEEGVRRSLALILEDEGHRVQLAPDADRALEAAERDTFDVVLCDVRMPVRSGLELLPDLIRLQPCATVLMMSAFGDFDQAIEAVRLGAYDFLAKPFQAEELLLTIRKAEERELLQRENRRLRREIDRGHSGQPAMVAASAAMREVYELIGRAAEYKTTVLVTGESGVGKEVVARSVHELSDRAQQPFIAVNCGAIPGTLIESELFGHARGAFTGADHEALGLFREADQGTLFLDEIGELPPATQVKLLRVLQEEEVRPIGESKPYSIDVRIIAATARDLEEEVREGRFRMDLFYRLNVFAIEVKPLRERREDIAPLADVLLSAHSRRLGKPVEPLERSVLELLEAHHWPGNVRELQNSLERALILARGDRLSAELFPLGSAGAARSARRAPTESDKDDLSIKRQSRALERRLIRRALHKTSGNRTRASRFLEISTRALQYKLKEYDIDPLNPQAGESEKEEHR